MHTYTSATPWGLVHNVTDCWMKARWQHSRPFVSDFQTSIFHKLDYAPAEKLPCIYSIIPTLLSENSLLKTMIETFPKYYFLHRSSSQETWQQCSWSWTLCFMGVLLYFTLMELPPPKTKIGINGNNKLSGVHTHTHTHTHSTHTHSTHTHTHTHTAHTHSSSITSFKSVLKTHISSSGL